MPSPPPTPRPLRVLHLMRKPQAGYHSFERLFATIRSALPADVEVRVIHCRYHTRGFFPRLANLIQALFIRADVVHITGDTHYLALGLIGRRVFLTVHDLAPLHAKRGWQRKLFQWLWYDLPGRIARQVTAVSAATREDLLAHTQMPSDKVSVIPNCVDPAFQPTFKDWPDRPRILMVGTRPHKNLERMFVALRGFPVEVRIVGVLTPEQRTDLAASKIPYQELGRLDDDALLAAYQDCDCLAFASTQEGFGLPVLEAQAVGRPVLTSAIPALEEASGQAACLVDPQSSEAIREGFRRVLEDPAYRSGLVTAGFENVKQYLPDAVAAQYTAAYRSVVSGTK